MTQPGEFTYRRVHRASRELLFDCMTQPGHLVHFWGPAGMKTLLAGITVDLRPGGAFETLMVSDSGGGQYQMRAVYVEVRRPERLVWTEPEPADGGEGEGEGGGGMTTTITFTDIGDGWTEVVTHLTNAPAMFADPAARAGFETSLTRFDEYIARLTAASGSATRGGAPE